jgi:hypothetical protein
MRQDLLSGWKPIDSAPKDEEILVYTQSWGPIVAVLSEEFGQWLSRMQVPVTITAEEAPTHWQPLPSPPRDTAERSSGLHPGSTATRG